MNFPEGLKKSIFLSESVTAHSRNNSLTKKNKNSYNSHSNHLNLNYSNCSNSNSKSKLKCNLIISYGVRKHWQFILRRF